MDTVLLGLEDATVKISKQAAHRTALWRTEPNLAKLDRIGVLVAHQPNRFGANYLVLLLVVPGSKDQAPEYLDPGTSRKNSLFGSGCRQELEVRAPFRKLVGSFPNTRP